MTENKLKGMLIDIQRCSMYDGPGVRTSVFFKGCPLSCEWCHNPESQSFHPQLAFHSGLYIGCKSCAFICSDVHSILNDQHRVDFSKCITRGKCIENCPTGALKIYGKEFTVDEVMEIVKRDRVYYEQTGGGLTISGGEPFAQFEFLMLILKAAKSEHIHTCVETCGYATRNIFVEAMPYIDLFLYDYKITSPKIHEVFTGVDNKLILDNLSFLSDNNKKIILRCSIIPGINDNMEHFYRIYQMEKRYPNLVGIEIMHYHDFGKDKANAIGRTYGITAPTADVEIKNIWRKQLRDCGCSPNTVNSF